MTDTPQPAEGQCAFFLPKKKRFCRFRPNPSQKYCAEHACVLGVELDRKRIVCPLNSKHTCYEDNLAKHLKKCNSRKRKNEGYYEEGINSGADGGTSVPDIQIAVKATDTEKLKRMIDKVNKLYEEHIGKVDEDVRSHQCLQEEMNNPMYGLPALRHRRQQASLIGQLEGLGLLAPGHLYVEMGAGKGQLSHWVREAVTDHDDAAFLLVDRSSIRYKVDGYHKEEEKVQFDRIKIDIEHLHLGKVPMVSNSKRPLVAIGKHLCGAATDLTLRCLMETVGSRNTDISNTETSAKRPRTEMSSDTQSEISVESLKAEVESGDKHETVGSEMIDSESNEKEQDRISPPDTTQLGTTGCGQCESSAGDIRTDSNNSVRGVVIALCCHHQCNWKSYVGKEFMQQCGVTAADFNLLTRLTSWAVCGWRDLDGSFGTREGKAASSEMGTLGCSKDQSEENDNSAVEELEHNTTDLISKAGKEDGLHLSEKEKEAVGWRCKRLIDYGRVEYLQHHGLYSNLKIYIDSKQTPENVVLTAVPGKRS